MAEDKYIPPTPPCDIVINRNDVGLNLEFFRILKGENENKFYPAPRVTPENLQTFLSWLGTTTLISELQTVVKRKFQNIAKSATGEDGVFNVELFVKYATEFTSAGMRIKEINDKLEELDAELMKIIDAGAWEGTDEAAVAARHRINELKDEKNAYKQMKEDKQRKPKADEAEEVPSV